MLPKKQCKLMTDRFLQLRMLEGRGNERIMKKGSDGEQRYLTSTS